MVMTSTTELFIQLRVVAHRISIIGSTLGKYTVLGQVVKEIRTLVVRPSAIPIPMRFRRSALRFGMEHSIDDGCP
jgi:hypothetical protein